MRDHRGIQAAAAFVAAACVGAMAAFALSRNVAPPEDPGLHREVGRAVAAEALRFHRDGGRITVFARDTSEFPQPAVDHALAGLQAALAEAGRPAPTVRRIAEDPLRPIRVPEGDVFDLLRKSRSGDVVVSFLGPAVLGEEQRQALGATPHAAVVAFCPGAIPETLDLARLASMGLLHGAVLSRSPSANAANASPASAPTGKAAFEARYRKAVPADLGVPAPEVLR